MIAPAKKAAPPAPSLVEIITDVEQNTPDWLALRLGIPTASNFSVVMRDGDSKTRDEYMRKLAGERLTNTPAENFTSKSMDRGREMEPEARDYYARTNFGVELERVGFMRRKLPSGRYAGASPDSLFNKRRSGLEIKTMEPKLLIDRLIKGAGMPPEHRAQVQGTMWVGELESVDLLLFYRGMPVAPKFTVYRDEAFIQEIEDAVRVFDHHLQKLVEKIQAMGPR